MPVWDAFITARDREVFSRSGYGRRAGFGDRPAVLVVDVTYQFIGDRPEPIFESMARWPQSAGDEGWRAVTGITTLLAHSRAAAVPAIYTVPVEGRRGARAAEKSGRRDEVVAHPERNTIPSAIAPLESDQVLRKEKPSAFFGTPLVSRLTELGVDTLLVAGGTISGCVRASVVDAFSYGYRVALVEECLFDRGQASRAIDLFDMQQKYADLVSLEEALAYLKTRIPPS
jgi:nicotinamidase-related amidase